MPTPHHRSFGTRSGATCALRRPERAQKGQMQFVQERGSLNRWTPGGTDMLLSLRPHHMHLSPLPHHTHLLLRPHQLHLSIYPAAARIFELLLRAAVAALRPRHLRSSTPQKPAKTHLSWFYPLAPLSSPSSHDPLPRRNLPHTPSLLLPAAVAVLPVGARLCGKAHELGGHLQADGVSISISLSISMSIYIRTNLSICILMLVLVFTSSLASAARCTGSTGTCKCKCTYKV